MRHQRFVLLSFVAAAVVVGMLMQSALVSGFAQFAVPDRRIFTLINMSSGIALLSGVATFIGLIRYRTGVEFVDDVVHELSQVTWPTREETMQASTTVVYTTIFVATLLALYDYVWKKAADFFLYSPG